jgi:hypothetical protein
MQRPFPMMKVAPAVVAAVMIMASPARAFLLEPLTHAERTQLLLLGRTVDLQALDRIDRRREFQRQQQQLREEDRRMNQRASPRLDVPKLERNCQLRIFGNRWLDKCR